MRPTSRLIAPALLAVAASYFAIGCLGSLEWADEGMIVYPGWRVARGAFPHRDFMHLFGPSLFYVHAALFRAFGEDLLVIRLWLVLVKAGTAVLVYLCARRLAAWPFALGASLLVVAVWGAPWWLFNAPYANHYAVTLFLAGVWLFLALPARFAVRCLAAGVCFGAAATFKQTSGLFASTALALSLLWDEPVDAGAAPPRLPAAAVPALRWAVLAGALGLCTAYVWPRHDAWTLAAIFAPVAALIAGLAGREARGHTTVCRRAAGIRGMVWTGLGMALPLLAYAGFYGAHGALAALVFNTMAGLPQRVQWFHPYALPNARALLLLAALAAGFAALRWWRMGVNPWRWRTALATGVVAASGAAFDVVRNPWQGTAWYADVFHLLPLALPLAVWAALVEGFRSRNGAGAAVQRLFCCVATLGLLFLYPSGDFWHVLMALPAFAPLFARHAERWYGFGLPATRGRHLAAACLVTLLLAACAPFVHALAAATAQRETEPGRFARASGIGGAAQKLPDALALIDHLDRQAAGRPLLVLSNEQMFYFLAGRESALDAEEFVLYLVGFGLMDGDDARAFLPERRMIERIAALRPIIVDYPNPAAGRFRTTFPDTWRFISARYRPAANLGKYRVLEWAG